MRRQPAGDPGQLKAGGRRRPPATPAHAAPSEEGPPARDDRDIFRLAPSLDAEVLETIAARLEFRGSDDGYARLSQAYFSRLPLTDAQRIVALGCGTGIELRALKRMTGPATALVGVDHGPALIDAARRRTADEGLAENVTYRIGDAHHTPCDHAEFDIVTLHTLISHVDDPRQVLREARRIVRPGGTVAIFDGDYASPPRLPRPRDGQDDRGEAGLAHRRQSTRHARHAAGSSRRPD